MLPFMSRVLTEKTGQCIHGPLSQYLTGISQEPSLIFIFLIELSFYMGFFRRDIYLTGWRINSMDVGCKIRYRVGKSKFLRF